MKARHALLAVAAILAGGTLAGCSLPGRAFTGGPNLWPSARAPGVLCGVPPATTPAPASRSRTGAARRPPSGSRAQSFRYNTRLDP